MPTDLVDDGLAVDAAHVGERRHDGGQRVVVGEDRRDVLEDDPGSGKSGTSTTRRSSAARATSAAVPEPAVTSGRAWTGSAAWAEPRPAAPL